MKWPWSRRQDEPRNDPDPSAEELFHDREDLGLEEHMVATANVMMVRDAINVFLAVIGDHREQDDHHCPPYCVPGQLANFLMAMDVNDLRMMLTVVLKDMVDNYLNDLHQTDNQ